MTLFDLPTSANKPDTFTSAFRHDQVNPVSSVPTAGGTAVTFECQSPANNYWVPRMPYFDVKLKVVITATGNALAFDQANEGSLVQFAEYPASHIVHAFSHSTNGASVCITTSGWEAINSQSLARGWEGLHQRAQPSPGA